MDSRTLLKFCRDAGLLDQVLDRTRVDLIFIVQSKKRKVIDFDGFIYCLQEMAKILQVPFVVIQNHVLENKIAPSLGPSIIPRLSDRLMAQEKSSSTYTATTPTTTDSPFDVRRANSMDLAALVSMRIQEAYEKDANFHCNETTVMHGVNAGLLEDGPGGLLQPRYYVCTEGDTIVGMIGISPRWNDLSAGCVWVITSMYVSETHRGQGIGGKMVREGAISDAEIFDVSELIVNVGADDMKKEGVFFERLNFVSNYDVIMSRTIEKRNEAITMRINNRMSVAGNESNGIE